MYQGFRHCNSIIGMIVWRLLWHLILVINIVLCVVLGPFLLTNLLLHNLKATAKETGEEGRIVNVASEAHKYAYRGGIVFDKLNDEKLYVPKLIFSLCSLQYRPGLKNQLLRYFVYENLSSQILNKAYRKVGRKCTWVIPD